MKGASDGMLLQSGGPRFGERVFYVQDDVRHWIQDAEWLAENGFRWPDSVTRTSDAELARFRPGRPFPRSWSDEDRRSPPRHSGLNMREVAASFLHGSGIEIGAGSGPLPIPRECEVRYADRLDHEQLQANSYPGQVPEEMMVPELMLELDSLEGIAGDSVDFIAASHVIEHTRNPIRAIIDASGKIRRGGHLLLIVPDMTKTFDHARELTTLAHLILDFYEPSAERDKQHFQEFYRTASPTPADTFECIWMQAWAIRFPIHYHTWTYESFREMVDWIIQSFDCYVDFWSQPTIGNEFYFVLHRPLASA
jgi:hypothetical protein